MMRAWAWGNAPRAGTAGRRRGADQRTARRPSVAPAWRTHGVVVGSLASTAAPQRPAPAPPGRRAAAGPASVLAAHRGGPGGTCACVVGAPPAAATAVLSHLVSWPVRAAKPFRNPRPVMLAGAGQVCEGSGHGALLEVGRVIVHGGDRRAGEAAMALMRMATCTQLGVDGWCLATPVGVGGRASGRSRVRPREP